MRQLSYDFTADIVDIAAENIPDEVVEEYRRAPDELSDRASWHLATLAMPICPECGEFDCMGAAVEDAPVRFPESVERWLRNDCSS